MKNLPFKSLVLTPVPVISTGIKQKWPYASRVSSTAARHNRAVNSSCAHKPNGTTAKKKNRRYQRFVYFTCPVHVVSPGLIEFVQDAGEPVTSPLQLEFEDGKVVVHVIP